MTGQYHFSSSFANMGSLNLETMARVSSVNNSYARDCGENLLLPNPPIGVASGDFAGGAFFMGLVLALTFTVVGIRNSLNKTRKSYTPSPPPLPEEDEPNRCRYNAGEDGPESNGGD